MLASFVRALLAALPLATAPLFLGPPPCSQVVFGADTARCDAAACLLEGNAQLRCGERWLHADVVEVYLAADKTFLGAKAEGGVTLVDGTQLILAESMRVGGDLISGAIGQARLFQYVVPAAKLALPWDAGPFDPSAMRPTGRRTAVMSGELQRNRQRELYIRHAAATLCDCGLNKAPSWRLDAPSIYVNAQASRAWVMWPVLRLQLWPGRMVPVTPPLLPISLPLMRRAPGLLPPRLQFFSPRFPTVDVPLFVPLGDSWDVTLTPGLRTDWRQAPRLGVRLRGRPSTTDHVTTELALTYDRRSAPQRLGLQVVPPGVVAGPRARLLLLHHHTLTWPQGTHAGALDGWAALLASLRWSADVSWAGDDNVLRDLAIAPSERAAAYLPSRSALTAANPQHYLRLGTDFMQRLDSQRFLADGRAVPAPSNFSGVEHDTVHRLASLQWRLSHLPWRAPVAADAEGGYVLLGSLAALGTSAVGAPAAAPQIGLAAPPLPFALHVFGAGAGIKARGRWRAMHLAARLGGDGVAALASDQAPSVALTGSLRGQVALPMLAHLRRVRHFVQPTLLVLAVAARGAKERTAGQSVARTAALAFDERYLQQSVLQAALVLRQNFIGTSSPQPRKLRLDICVPFDLRRHRPLRPSAHGALEIVGVGEATAYLGIDPYLLHRSPGGVWLQELDVGLQRTLGTWILRTAYLRLGPAAERLQRTNYVLAAPNAARPPSDTGAGEGWQHSLRFSLNRAPAVGLQLAYSGGVQLPRYDSDKGRLEPACQGARGASGRRACFISHMLQLGYASVCRCWRLDLTVSAAPQDLRNTLRLLVVLDVAGYRLGV